MVMQAISDTGCQMFSFCTIAVALMYFWWNIVAMARVVVSHQNKVRVVQYFIT